MSIERVVVVLTPIFAAAAGWVTGAVSQLVPGVNLNKGDVTAIFVAGALAALGVVHKWLDGRVKYTTALDHADQLADHVVARINANPQAGPALADVENLLKSHETNIVSAIGAAVHASPSVESVADQVLQRFAGAAASAPVGTTPPAAA